MNWFAVCKPRTRPPWSRCPGVGKKTAERLLVEIKDRFKAWENLPAIAPLVLPNQAAVAASAEPTRSAPGRPGLQAQEASRAVAAVEGEDLSSEETHPSRPEGHGLIP